MSGYVDHLKEQDNRFKSRQQTLQDDLLTPLTYQSITEVQDSDFRESLRAQSRQI